MTFYTNVARYGNSLLYRGYTDNGTAILQKYKFKPTMFVASPKQVSGKHLLERMFSLSNLIAWATQRK